MSIRFSKFSAHDGEKTIIALWPFWSTEAGNHLTYTAAQIHVSAIKVLDCGQTENTQDQFLI